MATPVPITVKPTTVSVDGKQINFDDTLNYSSRYLLSKSNNQEDKTSPEALLNSLYQAFIDNNKSSTDKRHTYEIAFNELANNRFKLSTILGPQNYKLNHLIPENFRYLNKKQKEALIEQLKFSYVLLYLQYQLDKAEESKAALSTSQKQLETCGSYIDYLEALLTTSQNNEQTNLIYPELSSHPKIQSTIETQSPPKNLHPEPTYSEQLFIKLAPWLGLTIVARFFSTLHDELKKGISDFLTHQITDFNGMRLYWVWGGGFLSTVLSLIPTTFFNTLDAKKAISSPAPYTGAASWILYYIRLGINLTMVAKHTINGPWMNAEEAQISWVTRSSRQIELRHGRILNDLIWGVANMACYFWLTGNGWLGYGGNALTLLLLVFDLTMAIKSLISAYREKNHIIDKYKADIAALQAQLDSIRPEHKESIEAEIKLLKSAQKEKETEWRYKKYSLVTDLLYAAGLIGAFAMLIGFLCPPAHMAAAVALTLGVVGMALCFVLNVAYETISASIEIAKMRHTRKETQATCAELLAEFKEAKNSDNVLLQKQLWLEMKQLMSQSEHQSQLINLQLIKLLQGTLIRAFIPAVVFSSMVFLGTGPGLGVLALGFAITHYVQNWVAHFESTLSASSKADKTKFDENAFRAFSKNPSLETLKPKSTPWSFYNKSKTPATTAPHSTNNNKDSEEDYNPLLS